jgi:hypothetical protein
MTGAALSRWTMSYFAMAIVCLLFGQGLLALGYGDTASELGTPQTLVVVHIVAIGWLGLLMIGASLQFVPVLVDKPLAAPGLAAPALITLVAGLSCLVLGFLALDGSAGLPVVLLPIGAILLSLGFSLAFVMLGLTLVRSRLPNLPSGMVAIGLASLLVTMLLGLVFALVLSGQIENAATDRLLSQAIPLHAALGLGGWLSLAAIGVSYRLLSMFMLSPETKRLTSRAVPWLAGGAVFLVVAAVVVIVVSGADIAWPVTMAVLLTLIAVGLYGHDVIAMVRTRRRKALELNIRMSLVAMIHLCIAVLLLAGMGWTGKLGDHAPALIYLVAFGWLTGLGLAKLYKIIPFLTWLECFGPVMGKVAVPRVQDLVQEDRAIFWFVLYHLGVAGAVASLFFSAEPFFRLAVALQLAATLAIVIEFTQARRLLMPKGTAILPDGIRKPRLVLPPIRKQEPRP